jgi:acyl carrier protein
MSKSEILERVVELLSRSFQIDRAEIVPTAHLFDELGLDSIDAIDLVVGLQEETGIKLREDELRAIRVVQDVVDTIHRHVGGS